MLVSVAFPGLYPGNTQNNLSKNEHLPSSGVVDKKYTSDVANTGKYNVTFTETGLPNGTTWYVNLTNSESSGVIIGSSYIFSLANGTYSYTIATTNHTYKSSQSSGSFTVNGKSINEPITFSKVTYSVTFTETGLPNGTTWYVNITNVIKSGTITGISHTFSLANGTYVYTVSTDNTIYSASPSSGSFTVNGNNISESITFSKVTYSVTFTETGLPNGTTWYVNLTNSNSGPITGSSYNLYLTNGTYTYTISTDNAIYSPSYNNIFIVKGAPVSESITFSKVTYSVTFTETGLPTATIWYVNLTNGQSFNSSTSAITFNETNGTYSYTIATTNHTYKSSQSSGSFTVNGKSINEPITFSKITVTYSVTFTETGLPTATIWYVNLTNGESFKSINSTITFNEPNGTYLYTVLSADNYSATPPSGNFTINGNVFNLNITYHKDAYIKLNIITPGSNITINGNVIKDSDGFVDKYLKQGYYYINATENNYRSYTDYIFVSFNNHYSLNISLIKINNAGYLSGVINPYNALIVANGVIVPVYKGIFNEPLAPGTYYVSITAKGHAGIICEINITAGKISYLNISLISIRNSITLSGYINTGGASITFNGLIAYVNSTGYYHISLPAGKYTVSLYYNRYFPYSKNISLVSSAMLNFTLEKEPAYTSYYSHSNITVCGYNATYSGIINGNGNVSMNFNATNNGVIIVKIPYIYMNNTSIQNILYSTVYINGISYSNYTITISSNYIVILTVKGLNGDPDLDWKYSPEAHVPVAPHKAIPNKVVIPTIVYEIIAFIVIIGIQVSAAILYIRKKNNKQ